jgi:hypothetical protein
LGFGPNILVIEAANLKAPPLIEAESERGHWPISLYDRPDWVTFVEQWIRHASFVVIHVNKVTDAIVEELNLVISNAKSF